MPEMYFHVTWPDGARDRCYSPSMVIEDYLTPGSSYPVPEFVRLSGEALQIASDRVQAKFGFACTSAAAQLEQIRTRSAQQPDGAVVVDSFERL